MTSTRKISVKLTRKKNRNSKRIGVKPVKSEQIEKSVKKEHGTNCKSDKSLDSSDNVVEQDTRRSRAVRKRKKLNYVEEPDDTIGTDNFTRDSSSDNEDDRNNKASGKFVCKICSKTFIHKTNVYKHCRVVHKTKYENERVPCYKCDKSFSSQEKMEKHLRLHEKPDKRKNKPGLQCFMCKEFFRTYGLLEKHLTSQHEKSFKLSEIHFNSNQEFMKWRYEYETRCMCKYVRRETPYKLKEGGRRYRLQCHRSGFFKSRGKGIRKLKKLGSNKIEGTCPSTILVTETAAGVVSVRNFECHEGHDFTLERLTLTHEERASIAGKLSVGVSDCQIINSVTSTEEKKRLSLLSKTDIRNIRRDFGIKGPPRVHKKRDKVTNQVDDSDPKLPVINDINVSSFIVEKTVTGDASSKTDPPETIVNNVTTQQRDIISSTVHEQEMDFDNVRSYTDLDDYREDGTDLVEACHDDEMIARIDLCNTDLIFDIQTKCQMILDLNSRGDVDNQTRSTVIDCLDKAIKVLNERQTCLMRSDEFNGKNLKQSGTDSGVIISVNEKINELPNEVGENFSQCVTRSMAEPLPPMACPVAQPVIAHPMSRPQNNLPRPLVQQITSTDVQQMNSSVLTVIHHQTDLNESFTRTPDFVDSGHSGFDTFVSCVLEIGGHNSASFT